MATGFLVTFDQQLFEHGRRRHVRAPGGPTGSRA
jgi:hypothetical protein